MKKQAILAIIILGLCIPLAFAKNDNTPNGNPFQEIIDIVETITVQVQDLSIKVSETNGSLSEIWDAITGTQNVVQELQSEVETLEGTVEEMETETGELQAEVEYLSGEIAELKMLHPLLGSSVTFAPAFEIHVNGGDRFEDDFKMNDAYFAIAVESGVHYTYTLGDYTSDPILLESNPTMLQVVMPENDSGRDVYFDLHVNLPAFLYDGYPVPAGETRRPNLYLDAP